MLHGFRLECILPPNAKPFVMGELGDLSESGITCLAVISFLQLLCKLWGFELGDNVHFGYCAHIYVAAVGLPMCYVVPSSVGWYFYVLFHVVFVLL